jgi:hypothetical protein
MCLILALLTRPQITFFCAMLYCHVWPVWFTIFFHIIPQAARFLGVGGAGGDITEHKMCALIFFATLD